MSLNKIICVSDMLDNFGYLLDENYTYKDIIKGLEFIDSNYDKMSKLSLIKYQENYSQNKFISDFNDIISKKRD